ncbi:MAG: hypothetical protein D6798_19945, partial [Deltaproteobacteria bacterium]
GGTDGGGADGGGTDGGADSLSPVFYFVLHADPATPDDLEARWTRLAQFMEDLSTRNASLASPHHVTIMFTPAWAELLKESKPARDLVASWVADGHQLAFHSHTHNHAYRDGYTNATTLEPDVDEDGTDRCWGDRDAGQCTLDFGLAQLERALSMALGSSWSPNFAAIGPHENGGPEEPNGRHDNSCNPALDEEGQPIADTSGCIDLEWVGDVATIPFATAEYDHVTDEMESDSADALLGGSTCKDLGEQPDVYILPHAPFQTEAGGARVSEASVLEALDRGTGEHRIGVVIHPISYAHTSSSGYSGDAAALIQDLFDEVEARGFRSVTLDEARAIDLERGGGCP